MKQYIEKGELKIIVRPNSPKTEVIRWDSEKRALRVNVHAHPEKGQANKEVVRFFSKKLKKKVVIKSGLKSRCKILQIAA